MPVETPTTDEIIDYALTALEEIRPAVPLLTEFNPEAGAIVGAAVPLLYEGLVALRSALSGQNREQLQAGVREKVSQAIQALAAAKFGATPNGE